ncbi:MAG: DUF4055 domain-containing protein [bacterium]|nr:DUF4055 domain-containing protein [bacterium]
MRSEPIWLPQKEGEEDADYTCRRDSSFLFEGYARTLDEMVARPFERPVTLQNADTLPEFLEGIEADVDKTGTSLTSFAKDLFRSAMHHGLSHVLVDFSRVPEGSTLADRRRIGARPLFVHVKAPQVINWRLVEDDPTELEWVAIYEEATIQDGTYGQRVVERVRVFGRQSWEIFQRDRRNLGSITGADPAGPASDPGPGNEFVSGGGWQSVAKGNHPFGAVPLVTYYTRREGFMVGRPVFEAVAWLNLAHWQSASRQRAYLDFARVGTMALFGFTKEQAKKNVSWGINRFIHTEASPRDADVKVITHQADAIEAGERDLTNLKEEMEALGTAPLVQRASSITATGETREESRGLSRAQSWVKDLEAALVQCYEMAAQWLGVELPEDFWVDVFSDFGITQRGPDELKLLVDLFVGGHLPADVFYPELKRRGIFSEAVDIDVLIAAVEQMAPAVDSGGPDGSAADEMPDEESGGGDEFVSRRADNHRHTYGKGDQSTKVDNHKHPVLPDGSLGPADGHSHGADPDFAAEPVEA